MEEWSNLFLTVMNHVILYLLTILISRKQFWQDIGTIKLHKWRITCFLERHKQPKERKYTFAENELKYLVESKFISFEKVPNR